MVVLGWNPESVYVQWVRSVAYGISNFSLVSACGSAKTSVSCPHFQLVNTIRYNTGGRSA